MLKGQSNYQKKVNQQHLTTNPMRKENIITY